MEQPETGETPGCPGIETPVRTGTGLTNRYPQTREKSEGITAFRQEEKSK